MTNQKSKTMFKDPSYNAPSDLNEDFVQEQLQQDIYYKITKPKITSILKKPKTNQYEVITNIHKSTSYYYFCHCKNNFKLHREDGPAELKTIDSRKSYEAYYQNGMAYRLNGPQEIQYNNNKINLQIYKINNNIWHREDGPAYTSYNSTTGNINMEVYYVNGKKHCENNPAYYEYDELGNKTKERWYKHGVNHRLDGPAYTQYSPSKLEECWIVNGRVVNLNEYPVVKDNKICDKIPLTKETILKTFLFDREYGLFLNEKYKELNSK